MDSLLNDMVGEGRLESQGQFTIDAGKIRERYESFQNEMPRYYLARLLQGLVELEPQSISVEVHRQKLVLRAEQPAHQLPLRPVPNLLNGASAFSQGLLTSFLTDCHELEVKSDVQRLRLLPDGIFHLSSINRKSGVEVSLSFARPKGLLGALVGRGNENAAIHSFLSYSFSVCAIPFVLDGRPINGSPISPRSRSPYLLVEQQLVRENSAALTPSVWGDSRSSRRSCYYRDPSGKSRGTVNPDLVTKSSPPHYQSAIFVRRSPQGGYLDSETPSPCAMIVALRCEMSNHSLLYMVDKGMVIEAIDTEIGCPGLVAVVSASHLSKDASGLRVVRNQAYNELTKEIKAQAALAFAQFESLHSWEKQLCGVFQASEELGRAQLAYGG